MTHRAFAAVINGRILVKTVSDTERAAMVNWLVTEAGEMIYQTDTDTDIVRKFVYANRRKGGCHQILPVEVSLASGIRET